MIYILITFIAFGLLFYLARGLRHNTTDKKWIILVTSVPVIAVGLYFYLGRPDYVDQPYALLMERKEKLMQESSENLITAFRIQLHENDSAEGRFFLGQTLARIGRFDEAEIELKKAYTLSKGQDINIAASYGEILVAMNNRKVSGEALGIFQNLIKQETDNPRALFYVGLYHFQNNNNAEGAALWQKLIDVAAGQPWQKTVLNNVKKSAEIHHIDLAKNNIILPDVQEEFTSDQIEMISGMVESLRQKVKDNPDDVALKARLKDVEAKFEEIKMKYNKK